MDASPDAIGEGHRDNFMNELQFDAPSHTYTYGSKRLPSVTEICKFAYPDAYGEIPEAMKAFYFSRGTAVHKLCEDVEMGIDGQFTYDKVAEEYRAGHAKWLRDTGFKALPGGIEMRVKNLDLGYAGCVDRLGTVGQRVWLVDLKTSSVRDQPTALQLALYLLAIPGYKFGEVERYGVAIKKNGTYAMSRRYPDSDEAEAVYWATKYKEAHK